MSTSILHLFFFTCFLLSKMHYLDHILECSIGPSLKVVQLRRLFDWTNMAAALHQFFGAARHPCFEVSDIDFWANHERLVQESYVDSTWEARGGGSLYLRQLGETNRQHLRDSARMRCHSPSTEHTGGLRLFSREFPESDLFWLKRSFQNLCVDY